MRPAGKQNTNVLFTMGNGIVNKKGGQTVDEYDMKNKTESPKKKIPKMGKRAGFIAAAAVGAAMIALLAGDATYQIQEQEQAVLTTLGVPKAVVETGLHFKIPFIQKVSKVNTTIQGFPIGYDMETNEMVEN